MKYTFCNAQTPHNSNREFPAQITTQASDIGITGEALPYSLGSDPFVTCLLFFCFILFIQALKNRKKVILQHLKNIFQYKKRTSLFDESLNSDSRYIVILTIITCILSALCIYKYFINNHQIQSPQPAHTVLLMCTYTGMILIYFIIKRGLYAFINWIFFDKERNTTWMQGFSDLIGGISFILFPFILISIYLNLNFNIYLISILFIIIFAKILLFYKCIKNFFYQIHGFLHLIVYFCALEIIPLLILLKEVNYVNGILILKTLEH